MADVLLERRKGAKRALAQLVATCYLLGVSTQWTDKLVARSCGRSHQGARDASRGAGYSAVRGDGGAGP